MAKIKHYIHRTNWIRAAILGANDGIISIASLQIGIIQAGASQKEIIITGTAAIIAGALSMSAGEYVSVSSQSDLEQAEISREAKEIEENPEDELEELIQMYQVKGLDEETAEKVAIQLTAHDAVEAHTTAELNISKHTYTNPIEAAFSSGISFTAGGSLPLLISIAATEAQKTSFLAASTVFILLTLGFIGAKLSAVKPLKPSLRITHMGIDHHGKSQP